MTESIRILKKATCPSLSNRSELTYEFGIDPESKELMFRIKENSGSGHFNQNWLQLMGIMDLLNNAEEPFSLSIFEPLYRGHSLNNHGFLGAVLMKEGLLSIDKRQYRRKDPAEFLKCIQGGSIPCFCNVT